MLEAQKRDQWAPKVGSMVFIPRMKGNFKVGHWHAPVDCISPDKWSCSQGGCMQAKETHAPKQHMLLRRFCGLWTFVAVTHCRAHGI